jgi:hypothetical protein
MPLQKEKDVLVISGFQKAISKLMNAFGGCGNENEF